MRVFISYRRSDSSAEAGRLRSLLAQTFGERDVFMDTSSIEAGATWPKALEEKALASTAVIVVIGPEWLRASNEYGERRIDMPDDWVRRELEIVLSNARNDVIPVLVRGAIMPPANKLPESINTLPLRQAVEIRSAYWDHDIQLVVRQLQSSLEKNSPKKSTSNPFPPPPPDKPDPVSEEKLEAALKTSLQSWKKVESSLPGNPGEIRIELFREFKFKKFLDAIEFMSLVAPGCDIAMHHPRWENIWTTLSVYLSTWDIGHRISDRDLQLALYFDRAFSKFKGAAKSKVTRVLI